VLLLKHCREFKEYDIWFLNNTQQFQDRKLFLGRCPICLKDVARLDETRISDGRIFRDSAIGHKAVSKLCDKVRHQIVVTAQEISIKKGKPYGWTYAENKEIHNNKGEVTTVRQKRCDFYGQKEEVKEFKIS